MRVTILLADKGVVNTAESTVSLLNAGWARTMLRPAPIPQMVPGGMMTIPHTVVVLFEVDFDRCNRPIELVLELVNEDGQPVLVPGPIPTEAQPMRFTQQVVIQSPGGAPIGTPGQGNALIEIFPGLPLPPGGYRWQARLDGEDGGGNWYAGFRVELPPQMPAVTFGAQPIPPSSPPSDEE